MGTKGNVNLENQLVQRYSDGLLESSVRTTTQIEFWNLFEKYNKKLSPYLNSNDLSQLKEETIILIHTNQLKKITAKYLK